MLSSLIVYVEDHEDDAFFMKRALEQARHRGEFVHLTTVAEAKDFLGLCVAEMRMPGLLLIDLHIAAEDGRDVMAFVRSNDALRQVPLVAISGSYVYDELEAAYEAGANLIMTKPLDLKGWTDLVFKLRDYFAPVR